jgi:putative protease
MADFKVGTVKHFYDKLGVAIVDVTNIFSVGDTIKFVRGGEDLFEQKVESIQVEHKKLDSANSGDVVGLKTERQVKEGAEIYKVE